MSETKHNFLKRILQEDIVKKAVGERIATENELCLKFGMSRMTVNKVICELEKEGYLVRRPRLGTFIRERSMESKIVTFLLPCPDEVVCLTTWSRYRCMLLSGAMDAIRIANARLETLPVSPTNNMDDIDFSRLKNLKPGSLVIVTGVWYSKIFKLLDDYACKVCFLDEQVLYSYKEEKKYTRNWLIGDMDIRSAVKNMVLKLHQKGCRRIAILSPYLLYEGHPRTEGYRDGVRQLGLPEIIFEQESAIRGRIPKPQLSFLIKNDCDGLILECSDLYGLYGQSLNSALGIPENICIGAFNFMQDCNFFSKNPIYFRFDFRKIGFDSVKRLLSEKNETLYKIYKPIFSNEGKLCCELM